MVDKKTSSDEESKNKTAKKVVTTKALYFVPSHNVSVEADSPDDAVEKAKKLTEQDEDGDG